MFYLFLNKNQFYNFSFYLFQSRYIHEEENYTQNYFYAPIISSHKKKVFHKRPVIITPPCPVAYPTYEPPFILEKKRNRNPNHLDVVYHNQTARSSSTDSSASSTTTVKPVDTFSSTPVVIPTKFFYRRRQVSFKNVHIYIMCVYLGQPCIYVFFFLSLVFFSSFTCVFQVNCFFSFWFS